MKCWSRVVMGKTWRSFDDPTPFRLSRTSFLHAPSTQKQDSEARHQAERSDRWLGYCELQVVEVIVEVVEPALAGRAGRKASNIREVHPVHRSKCVGDAIP